MLLFLGGYFFFWGGGGGHAYSENCTHGVSWSIWFAGYIEPQHYHLFCTVKLSKSSCLIAIAFFRQGPLGDMKIILASHILIQMAKLRIIWKKSSTVKNALIFHMVRPMINLPHFWGKLSHLTNIVRRSTFDMKLLRMRRWSMYGEKDKYLYHINYLSPSWSSTSLI